MAGPAEDPLQRIATHSFLSGWYANNKGSVLTVELIQHGKHILRGERSGKCLRCYPTIARN
jgi:hypothetical protein